MTPFRFVVLYVIVGIGWIFYNAATLHQQMPDAATRWAQDVMRPRYLWLVVVALLLWPVWVMLVVFPGGPSRRFLEWSAASFRRSYIDGPKWQDVLSEPVGHMEKPKRPLSEAWSHEDRLRAIVALLPDMQTDIYAGRYSEIGRPNITSLLHIAAEPANVLETYRAELEAAVAKYEEVELGREGST